MNTDEYIRENIPLPSNLIGTDYGLILSNYSHPLPDGFMYCNFLILTDYHFPLPQSFSYTTGFFDLRKYGYVLPDSMIASKYTAILDDYFFELPKNLVFYGELNLRNYLFHVNGQNIKIQYRINPVIF